MYYMVLIYYIVSKAIISIYLTKEVVIDCMIN